jgi:hypothetical protein
MHPDPRVGRVSFGTVPVSFLADPVAWRYPRGIK